MTTPWDEPPTRRATAQRRTATACLVIAAIALGAGAAACAEEQAAEITASDYRRALGAVSAATTDQLETIPTSTEETDVASFATAVAGVLGDEADAARELGVPDELEDDHRAFVRNTDEQSSGWRALAATAPHDPAFADLARNIGELTLGRNDLAVEMGVDDCVRSPSEP